MFFKKRKQLEISGNVGLDSSEFYKYHEEAHMQEMALKCEFWNNATQHNLHLHHKCIYLADAFV